MDAKSFANGFLCGLMGKGVLRGKEPVAYLYNGVQLPKLPEWDKTKYPYAYIEHRTLMYWLYVADSPLSYAKGGGVSSNGEVINYVQSLRSGGEWHLLAEKSDTVALYNFCIWTNTDTYSEDGTLYLAASEPIPVYE